LVLVGAWAWLKEGGRSVDNRDITALYNFLRGYFLPPSVGHPQQAARAPFAEEITAMVALKPALLLALVLGLALISVTIASSSTTPDAVTFDTFTGSVLVIGASGAIGRRLTARLLSANIPVVAGLRKTPLPDTVDGKQVRGHPLLTEAFGVDCTDAASIESVFASNPSISTVWNLAAPLSVETASNPALSMDVTVGGMRRILNAMRKHGTRRVCFSDSIGSFGASSPREGATAEWLIDNPSQDPGSDYGVMKRMTRELMKEWRDEDPEARSSRFAVIPGVLHDDDSWGAGTTEYVLDALKAAADRRQFVCPVGMDVKLPMILTADLIEGLYRLTVAAPAELREKEGGYALAGFSFSPRELFAEMKLLLPSFEYTVQPNVDTASPAGVFALLWPDSLSGDAAERDLGFASQHVSLRDAVKFILKKYNLPSLFNLPNPDHQPREL
jgi:nucleoside-diphosphate-sugar epimerase